MFAIDYLKTNILFHKKLSSLSTITVCLVAKSFAWLIMYGLPRRNLLTNKLCPSQTYRMKLSSLAPLPPAPRPETSLSLSSSLKNRLNMQ